MSEVICIDPQVMEKAYANTRAYLKTQSWKNKSFFQHMYSIDDSTTPIPSEGLFHTYKSLEYMLSGFFALKETLGKEKTFTHSIEADPFVNLYALYGGLCKGNTYLKIFFPDDVNSLQNGDLLNFKNGSTAGVCMQLYFEKMNGKVSGSKKLAYYTKSFYQYLFDVIESWKVIPSMQTYVNIVDQLHIKMEDYILSGFNYAPYTEQKNVERVSLDLVGVDDVVQKLEKYARQLFLYDISTKKNIEANSIPRTILLYSKPGTGKSSLISYLIQFMKNYSVETGKPFSVAQIDNTIKNMYHGESVKNLVRLLQQTTHPEKIGLVIIDDIDMVLQSRSDPFANHAELQIVAELMQYISGIYTNHFLGNHINIFMTNAPQKIDAAIMQGRIEESMWVKGPSVAKEYEQLLTHFLDAFIQKEFIAIKNIEDLSKICEYKQFSGRETKNIAKLIQASIIGDGPTSETCKLNPQQQIIQRARTYKKIDSACSNALFSEIIQRMEQSETFEV